MKTRNYGVSAVQSAAGDNGGPARGRALAWSMPLAVLLLAACSPSGDKLYARAEQAMADGKYRAAMIDLKNLVQKDPTNARARAALGLALLEMGDVEGAAVEVQKARDAGGDRAQWILPHCRVMVAQAAYDKVLEECTTGGVDAKQLPGLNSARGGAYLGLQRYGEAQVAFQQAMAANPDDLDALQGLASAAYAGQGVGAARAVLEKASDTIKARPRYWLTIGGFELRAGEYAAAEKAFQSALDKVGDDVKNTDRLPALAGLAEAQVRQNKSKEATATSELLLAAAPKSALAKFMRAQAAIVSGDLPQAKANLEEVVTADPRNGQARTMLGYVNLEQGNLGQAAMHLSSVVAAEPNNWLARRLLAETRTRQRQPEEALKILQSAPSGQGQSANPALLAMAGRLSLGSGDKAAAMQLLDQAAQSKSDSPEIAIELATGFLMAGEIDKAIETIESLPETSNASGYQREYLLMLALVAKGQQEAAISRAQELSKTRGYDPRIRNLVGAMYAALGKKAEARAEFDAAVKADPASAAGYMNLARLEIAEKNWDGATLQLKTALEKEPSNLQATLGMAAIASAKRDQAGVQTWLDKAAADHPESVAAKLALGQYYLQTKDYAKAQAIAAESAKLAPNDPSVANLQGVAAIASGDLPGGIAALSRAVQMAPNSTSYRLNLARAYTIQRDFDKALKVYDEALAKDGGNFVLLTRAAITAFGAGNEVKGETYVAKMREIAPESPVTLALQGDVATRKKQHAQALGLYDRAFAKAPTGMLAINRYRAGMAAGTPDAVAPLNEWLRTHPNDFVVRLALGEHLQEQGDLDGALREYGNALEQSPDNAAVLNNMAYVYLLKGDPKALTTAEKAYAKLPMNPAVQDTYGWALVQDGQLDKGLDLLRRAASDLPGNADVQMHLANALLKAKQPAEARQVLNRVLAGDAPAKTKAAARELLAASGL